MNALSPRPRSRTLGKWCLTSQNIRRQRQTAAKVRASVRRTTSTSETPLTEANAAAGPGLLLVSGDDGKERVSSDQLLT